MMNSKKFLISAAVSGILSAGIASAAHAGPSTDDGAMGRCMGANSCKKTSDCTMKNNCASKNGCKGKNNNSCASKNGCSTKNGCNGSAKGENSCKGKGFVATTKTDCKNLREADIKSNKNHKSKIHFVKGLPDNSTAAAPVKQSPDTANDAATPDTASDAATPDAAASDDGE